MEILRKLEGSYWKFKEHIIEANNICWIPVIKKYTVRNMMDKISFYWRKTANYSCQLEISYMILSSV
jgi:hypothetical protein